MKIRIFVFVLLSFAKSAFAQDTTYNSVTQQLLDIDQIDQHYRVQIDWMAKKYGRDSKEMHALFNEMRVADSANLFQVESIIKKYGWLGYDQIGTQANTTLFMVIQHADSATQEKYLPVMREAVKNGNAKATSLALLEDRIALNQRKMQTYGSQVYWSESKNRYFVLPLADPDNVDKRRVAIGLQPLGKYVSFWDIEWNVEQYKKDLPAILTELKKEYH